MTRPSHERRRPHLARRIGDHGTASASDPFKAGERHHHRIVAGEPDHLAGNESVAASLDHDAGTDRHRVNGAGDLDHQAAHTHHAAINIDAIDVADLFGQSAFIAKTLSFRALAALPLTLCLPASLIIASLSLVTESAQPSERRANCGSRLDPTLNVELERDRVQKTASTQHLRAIRQKLH